MDDALFDRFSRLLAARQPRRTGLVGLAGAIAGVARASSPRAGARTRHGSKGKRKSKRVTICAAGQTLTVGQRTWQRQHPGATRGACIESCASCPSTCFAVAVRDDQPPSAYGCCPAESLCLSPRPDLVPDQCCYAEDEVCDAERAVTDPNADSLCCRVCTGGCCARFEHCVDGRCDPLPTARLPRYRRP